MKTTSRAAEAVDALIGAGLLDAAERARSVDLVDRTLASDPVRSDDPLPDGGGRRGLPQLVEVVAYLGGALVLAASSLFLVQEWGSLGFVARTVLIALVAGVLGTAGVLTARVPGGAPALREQHLDTRRRLGGTLLVGAGLAAAFLVGHTLDHFTQQGSYPSVYWPSVTGALTMVAASALAYRLAPTALALLGMLGAAVTADLGLMDGISTFGSDGDRIGISLLGVAVVWLVLAEQGVFRELTIARTLGVALALLGAQVPALDGTHAWLGYLLTVAVAVAAIALYLTKTAWPYLAVAVLAVTLVVPEAVSDWTEGSLGAAGGVLVAGITLLAASLAGYRLRTETTD